LHLGDPFWGRKRVLLIGADQGFDELALISIMFFDQDDVTHSGESGLVDDHPEDKRQRLLDGSQKQSIFLDTRTDDTDEKLEDVGKEMGDNLHDPETQPDCLRC
jgi:hypothetical protein